MDKLTLKSIMEKILFFLIFLYSSSSFAGYSAYGWVPLPGPYYSLTPSGACTIWGTNQNNETREYTLVSSTSIQCTFSKYIITTGYTFVAIVINTEIPHSCVVPLVEQEDGSCIAPDFDCFNSYNDLDIVQPGIQCTTQKGTGQPNPQTCNGNPCDAASGNKFQTEIDYQSNSIHFIRYYNSFYETQSVLGKQLTHDYLGSLTIGDTIKVNRPDGKVLEFHDDAGNWVSDADITETLTPVGSLWEYKTSNDSVETYNATGLLINTQTTSVQ